MKAAKLSPLFHWAGRRLVRRRLLAAANLGDDADTTAAIAGQVAGAYYGFEGIPRTWLVRLAKLDLIDSMARDLHDRATGSTGAQPAG